VALNLMIAILVYVPLFATGRQFTNRATSQVPEQVA
jgi:hypothetical protein